MPLLEVNNLQTSFHTREGIVKAVRGVSFSLEKGQTLGIVGESGSGKSVTAYAMMRLIESPGKVTAGSIVIEPTGEPKIDVLGLSPKSDVLQMLRGRLISMVFQEPMAA